MGMRLNRNYLLLSLLLSFGLVSCNPNEEVVVEKYSEVLCQAVYGAGDALVAGRADLAEQYIVDAEKILPTPTSRLIITPVIYQGVHYVILNDRETGAKVIIVGSAEFNNLLKVKAISAIQQKTVSQFEAKAEEQAKNDQAAIQSVVTENTQLKTQHAQDQAEITAYHSTAEYKIKTFFHWITTASFFFIPISIIAIIALMIFVPPSVPIIMEIAGSLFGIFYRVMNYIFSGLLNWLLWVTTPKTS